MNLEDRVERIKKSQRDPNNHPLTCGNNSNHQVLEPHIEDDKIILKCPDCEYIQCWIPDCIYNLDLEYTHSWGLTNG